MKHHPFLRELGRRLRAARQAEGYSVAELADRADLSRRYLTDAEAGRANPSVLVLLRLAKALGTSLAGLVDIPLRERLAERVALVGLRGAGKTTVGRQLALALEVPFVELDESVERSAGLPLGQLFDLHGAESFQRYLRDALEAVLAQGERLVLAAGGSIADDEQVFSRLLETSRTVWLAADPREHYDRVAAQGDLRPMAGRPRAFDELEQLLERRRPAYERCELKVDTSGQTPEEVTEQILAFLSAS
ncbi:shikimate kinase [Engelhardtia mirabilis]|uniref:Shikimate kinase n=1 Tax=Engelhardtia mirabilis TaxID=2528011 RepID=A0A518BJH7_9BACT|nr:Shikimate kinase [Planctomycetes bacterium Pla133]QDV01451.1 Shikimate kinase [Planctomycetes bacterium Pla86]